MVTAQEVFNALFNPNEIVNIRIFEDKGSGVFHGMKIPVEAGKYTAKEHMLKEHNALNRGIFFVVNSGGDDDKSITKINAQFVEMDHGSFEEQQAKIDAFKYPPSMIIQTKKSLHTYWFIKNGDVAKFRGIQKQLVAQFEGDPMCVNESRCMRLPGFNHCKTEPVEVKCILFHPERKYTQEELSDALPQMEASVPVAKMQGTQKGLDILQAGCEFLKFCKDNAATLSEHDWYAMITNLAVFSGGTEVIHDYSKPHPGYDEIKTQKKINHFLDSNTGPITCEVIASKGFKCPKMVSGECTCKAPAALAFVPLGVDAIRTFLGKLPVKNSVIDDMQIARKFVEDYLYNVDQVTADTIINYELKTRFSFKKDDLKPLLALQKELFKKYQASTMTKKMSAGMDVPPWYDLGEKGFKFKPGILAEHLRDEEKVFYAAEQYYLYGNGVYSPITDLSARNIVRCKMIPSETKLSQITDAEGQWKMQIQTDLKDLNANPYIINVQNGLYNVLENTLSGHTSEYLSTVQIRAKYDPKASCPRFIQYLHESLEQDQIELVQEMMGYFLLPTNRAQKAFLIVGVGGSGKSKLLLTISDLLLGKENVSNVSWQALNERFKPAELCGKLLNSFADLPTKHIDDNGIFKALVGEDYLTVERKNRDPFSFQSYARLLFSCNSIPKNYGDRSDGFYRRLIIIKFNHAVPKDKRDPELLEKFRAEVDGILLFALEGLKRLMKNGFNFSETQANLDALQQYKEDSNSCLAFVKECCEIDATGEVGATHLYERYTSFCKENGMLPYGKQTFNKELESNFCQIVRGRDTTGNRRIWKGIRFGECID